MGFTEFTSVLHKFSKVKYLSPLSLGKLFLLWQAGDGEHLFTGPRELQALGSHSEDMLKAPHRPGLS